MPDDRLTELLRRWAVVPEGAPRRTPTSTILFGRRRGEPVVLKIASHEEERRGARLMAWWAGRGAAEVLEIDGDAVLMRRATGSRDLVAISQAGRDQEATEVQVSAVLRLHGNGLPPAEVGLLPLETWFRALLGTEQDDPLLGHCAAVARRVLAGTLPDDVVALHGDVHHRNVLDAGDDWVAIDPKALVGHRAFDLANLFCNPDEATAVARLEPRLRGVATAAAIRREALEDWIVAWCGLSLAWGDPAAPSWHDRAARAIAERLLSAR